MLCESEHTSHLHSRCGSFEYTLCNCIRPARALLWTVSIRQRASVAMDSLNVLREFSASGRGHLVCFSDNFNTVKFGDKYEIDSHRPTRFCKGDSGAPYHLGALVLFMQCENLPSKQYFERAAAANIERITRADNQVRASACVHVCTW